MRIVAGNSGAGLTQASGILGNRPGRFSFWLYIRCRRCARGEDEQGGDRAGNAQVSGHKHLQNMRYCTPRRGLGPFPHLRWRGAEQ